MTILETLGRIAKRLNTERTDGWWNPITGFGDPNRDKSAAAQFSPVEIIPPETLTALFHGDDMAKRIVDMVPRAMLRQGFALKSQDQAAALQVTKRARELDVAGKVLEGMTWGRLYGGGIAVLGLDDGQPLDRPLNPQAVRALSWIKVHDRRDLTAERKYGQDGTSPSHPKFGEVEVFRISDVHGRTALVHESRCIVFRGSKTADRERQQNDGWDLSVLNCCWEPLRQFNSYHKAGELLIQDASQGVYRLRGLLGMLGSNGATELAARMTLLDMGRSVARAIMLDSEMGEDFTKVATSFAGVPDMLDRSANRLAAAAEIPVALLMGRAPAGLNATGESDIRAWYDTIQTDRIQVLEPILRFVVGLVATSLGLPQFQFQIVFPPLWQETPTELAARRKTVADADAIYLDRQVVMPEEVAKSRFGPGGWSEETTIDLSLREVLPTPKAAPVEHYPDTPPAPPAGPDPLVP